MLQLRGASAVSESRRTRLLAHIRARIPAVTDLRAEFVHFAHTDGELDSREREILERILEYGPRAEAATALEPEGRLLLVVPRLGTISPWSSKATDIAHICGLTRVLRLERGIAYHIAGADRDAFPEIAPLVHDRMTETVLPRFEDAAQLFSRTGPVPFTSVDVLGSGHEALEKADHQLGLALAKDEIERMVSDAETHADERHSGDRAYYRADEVEDQEHTPGSNCPSDPWMFACDLEEKG